MMFGRNKSHSHRFLRNEKSWKSENLIDGNYGGLYELEDGTIMDCHDSDECQVWYMLGPSDEPDPDVDGALEYTLYRNGEYCGGGITGYTKQNTLSDLQRFMDVVKHGRIKRKIVDEDTAEYRELREAIDEGLPIKGRFGLKNRKRGC